MVALYAEHHRLDLAYLIHPGWSTTNALKLLSSHGSSSRRVQKYDLHPSQPAAPEPVECQPWAEVDRRRSLPGDPPRFCHQET